MSSVGAQSSNAAYTLIQETVSSGGGRIGGGNPLQAQTILGLPAGGRTANSTVILYGGLGGIAQPTTPPPVTMTITVTGSLNDPTASVTVNGMTATVSGATFAATGIPLIAGPNILTAIATDPSGNQASKSRRVWLDLPSAQKIPRFAVTVRGSIDDATATVSVNHTPATIANGAFSASVMLIGGYNTLTATATDPAGNQRSVSIGVFVPAPTVPPARPTVGTQGTPPPTVTTNTSVTFGGTKTSGTSIWINSTQVWAQDNGTTWSTTLSLVEGDNILVIVAKDAVGSASAPATINIIVDNQPPEIRNVTYLDAEGAVVQVDQAAGLPKTNFDSVVVRGEVDDSLTSVTINTVTAMRTGRTFEATVPVVLGATTIAINALSPNSHPSATTGTVSRGTIPSVAASTPATGQQVYAGVPTIIQITAVDTDNDAVQYQVRLGGQLLSDWSDNPSIPWTASDVQRGPHVLEVRVRDAFGGYAARQADIFVGRAHVQPVSP